MYRVNKPIEFSVSRRSFGIGSAALIASSAFTPAFASVDGFVDGVWRKAKARGVSKRVFDIAMGDFKPLGDVLELSKKQPEFVSTAADYVNKTLKAVSERYGVQGEIVLAIWGIETNFGGFLGGTNTVHALATLDYGGYRSDFFGSELVTALEILEGGHVRAKDMVGSWAGAMGLPQFMPSSFMKYAVDFKGDGHKDIWGSVPDAQASIANYLKSFGWRPGETWGYEVKLARDFNYQNVWQGITATLGDWRGVGVSRANGKPFTRDSDTAKLYMPMGGNGPVFAVLPNFGVIKRYNNSDSYALAVGHLADRIIGSKGFMTPWPHDTALNADGRKKVQALLLKKGYQIGTPDGEIGPKTRAAVIDWQARAGVLADGHVSGNLLNALS